jgi:ectoine hydroxylase-related dioxygenase (phytanoyl-CoA dioxygenase family)
MRRQLDAKKDVGEDPGEKTAEATDELAGDYIIAHNAWRWNDELRNVAFDSPMAELSAQLMGAMSIRFYFDQIFIKPPGSNLRTTFHQDLGYWTCLGDQICTFWAPADIVTVANGAMGYVPGSHLWDEKFKANFFIDRKAIKGQEGDDLPDIESDEARYGVVYIECEPGDVIVHHVKTVHGSGANVTSDATRRSIAFRYTGEDVLYHLPPGIPADSTPVSATLLDGEPLSGDLFPLVWPKKRSGVLRADSV